MGVRLQTSLNNGLNKGLRQSISGGVVSLAFLEYTTASVSSFELRSTGTVNYDVDWGDGSTDTGVTTTAKTHTYSTAGVYTIKITPAEGSTFRPEHYGAADFQTSLTKVDGTGGSSLDTDLTKWLRETTSLTSFGSSIDLSHVTVLQATWRGCTGLTSFPAIDTSSCTNFLSAWQGCTGLTSFPLIDTSSGTSIRNTWQGCTGLTSFPSIDTSNVTTPRDAWNGCTGLTSFAALDLSSGTDFRGAWFGCSSLTSFPSITPTSGTDFGGAWMNCTSLTTYPANQFDNTGTLVSAAFNTAFSNCALTAQSIENILTSLDTNGASNIHLAMGGGTNANASTWTYDAVDAYVDLANKGWTITQNGNVGLGYTISNSGTSFELRAGGTVNYKVDWGDGSAVETSTANNLSHTYATSGTYKITINSNSGAYYPLFADSGEEDQITSIVYAGTDSNAVGTSLRLAFFGANNMTEYKQIESATASVTTFESAWANCSGLTSFPLIDTSSGTNLKSPWFGCSGLTSFPLIDTSSATTLQGAWNGCTSLTSFPAIDTSSSTTFFKTWYANSSLESFPLIDTSAGVYFTQTWFGNGNLDNISNVSGATTSFPLINTSSGITFEGCWMNCSSFVSFPALDFSSATTLKSAWNGCQSLTTFPANLFDSTGTLASNAFFNTWIGCALTAQSIENILTSLDTNGASNISLVISGGTNAAKSTWSSAANTAYNNLVTKGWTITFNS